MTPTTVLLGLLLLFAVAILHTLWRILDSIEGFKRQFIGAMGDDEQIYLRTIAQVARQKPYR